MQILLVMLMATLYMLLEATDQVISALQNASTSLFTWFSDNQMKANPDKFHLKVGFSPSKNNSFIRFNENPLNMMKNAFYFILKAFFVLKIFKFLFSLFGRKSGLIRKVRLISKFVTS